MNKFKMLVSTVVGAMLLGGVAFAGPINYFTAYIWKGDESTYTVKYKYCVAADNSYCTKWSPDTTAQIIAGSGMPVKITGSITGSGEHPILLSVTDANGLSLSSDALNICSTFLNGNEGTVLVFYHLGDRIACKSGGFTKK